MSTETTTVTIGEATTVTVTAATGPRGPAGADGGGGGGGGGAGLLAYTHDQPVASDTWVIAHNLGYRPAGVHVLDSADVVWVPAGVVHDSLNQLTIIWSAPFSGVAYLS